MRRLPRLTSGIFALILAVLLVPSIAMLWYVKASMERMLREEISLKVVQNLQRSENEISQLFSRMANISTVFYLNPEMNAVFCDDGADYYQRYSAFKNVIADIALQNLYNYTADDSASAISHIRISMMDERGRIYAGWSQNFRDYSYLFKQDWLFDERSGRGFMLWNMRCLGYAPDGIGADDDQIALSRSIMAANDSDRRIGTLLITVNRSHVADILAGYKYDPGDVVFASSPLGDVLFCQGGDEADVAELPARFLSGDEGTSVVDLNDGRYLLTYYTINQASTVNRSRLKVFYLTDYQHLDAQIATLVRRINIICIVFAGLVLALAARIAIRIARPVREIAGQMAAYRAGDVPEPVPARNDEIGGIQTAYREMSVKINDLLGSLRREQETREKYHYESLKAKMSPHFLFNTLNSIRFMAIIRKADNITSSVDALASILRYSLTNDDEIVELSQELDIVKRYCEIHNLRSGNRDRLVVNATDESMSAPVIKFILQPAVENCFKHAFSSERGGVITISAEIAGGALNIEVADDGPGFSRESLEAFAKRREGHDAGAGGLGLNIVDERIRVAYGPGYGITPVNDPSGGARLVYRLRLDEAAKGGPV